MYINENLDCSSPELMSIAAMLDLDIIKSIEKESNTLDYLLKLSQLIAEYRVKGIEALNSAASNGNE